jgi:hypothetical protein
VDHLAHMRLIAAHHSGDLRRLPPSRSRTPAESSLADAWTDASRLEIDFNRAPSSGESSRTNTSGRRITTSRLEDARPHSPSKAHFRSNVSGRPTSAARGAGSTAVERRHRANGSGGPGRQRPRPFKAGP